MRPRISVIPATLAAITAALAGTLTACSSSGTSSSAAFSAASCQGGTLTVLEASTSTIDEMDPARLYTSGGGEIPALLFRELVTRDREPGAASTKVVADLATDTGEPSANATVWTYHLKPGQKYQDGTTITSDDIKYGIERSFSSLLAGGPPYLRDWLVGGSTYQGPYTDPNGLASIVTPNPTTIVFHLRKSEGDFPLLAAETQFAPVPKAKDTGTRFADAPFASGPYEVKSFAPGKELVLARNPYWQRASGLDASQRLACPDVVDVKAGLESTVINQRLAASTGADADAITTDTNVGPTQLAQLAGNKGLASRVVSGAFPQTEYIAFNTKIKPFDDIRVREAFSYAIDRRSVVDALGGSAVSEPATTFLPTQSALGYHPYDYFPTNVTKAKQLLAAAGYPNGITLTLEYENTDSNERGPAIATALQATYKQAGINLTLKAVDSSAYDDTMSNTATEPGLFLFTWGADWLSGGPFLTPIFDGREIVQGGGNYNLAQFDSAAVNAEIDHINTITDNAAAQTAWGNLDAELGQQALDVPMTHDKGLSLYGAGVKNAYLNEWRGTYDISTVSVK